MPDLTDILTLVQYVIMDWDMEQKPTLMVRVTLILIQVLSQETIILNIQILTVTTSIVTEQVKGLYLPGQTIHLPGGILQLLIVEAVMVHLTTLLLIRDNIHFMLVYLNLTAQPVTIRP